MFRNEFLINPLPIEALEQDTLYLLGLAEAHHSPMGRLRDQTQLRATATSCLRRT